MKLADISDDETDSPFTLYFVSLPDVNVSEKKHLEEVFKVAKKAGLQPERIDSEDLARLTHSDDSFVIPCFRGKLFNEIPKKNIKIYGPPIVFECIHEGKQLPQPGRPCSNQQAGRKSNIFRRFFFASNTNFYSSGGVKLKVEEFRTKEEREDYPEGFWEERFKSFTDHKQHGSSSVGVDISIVNFKTAYGLPEHADASALRNTVGNTDPYRLYYLDVFEYELNNPMVDAQSSVTSKGLFGKMLDKVTGSSDNVPHLDAHFMSESGLVDIFFFFGPTVKDVKMPS
ncbi:unnamed protein product [Caenorhabditis brenneri]